MPTFFHQICNKIALCVLWTLFFSSSFSCECTFWKPISFVHTLIAVVFPFYSLFRRVEETTKKIRFSFAFQPYAHKTPTIIYYHHHYSTCVIILCERVVWILARFRVLKNLITLRVCECLFICCCYYIIIWMVFFCVRWWIVLLILEHVSLI